MLLKLKTTLTRFYPELLLVLCGLAATGIAWLLVRNGTTPNGRAAVEQALRQARLADIESIAVYPLQPGQSRPFEVRDSVALRPLLPALQQLRPVAPAPAFEPLLEATLMVRLRPALAAAQHLHSRTLIFRLATSADGEVAQLAQTNSFYHAAALSQRIWRLRDSLAARH